MLEREYNEKRLKIQERWSEEEKALEKKRAMQLELQGDLIFENNSLADLIKEYAIFSLAQKGEIDYPKTMEERGMMLAKLDISKAIKEFLDSPIELSENESRYLESFI